MGLQTCLDTGEVVCNFHVIAIHTLFVPSAHLRPLYTLGCHGVPVEQYRSKYTFDEVSVFSHILAQLHFIHVRDRWTEY